MQPKPLASRPFDELPHEGPILHTWDALREMELQDKWDSATPSAIREMALQTALQYTHNNLDQYRNCYPESLLENNTMLQLMWLGSAIHIDVQQHHQLPTRSKLIPSTLTIGLTQLFYRGRHRRGPHIRKTDKAMELAIFSKKWFFTERANSLLDPAKYRVHTTPTTYDKCNANRIYMMPKIHKGKIPVPGCILVQGFSYLEASAKFISYFGYSILKVLLAPLTFHECRAEYEYMSLNMAL